MGLIVDTSVVIASERSSSRLTLFRPGGLLFRAGETVYGLSVLTLSELAYGYVFNTRISSDTRSSALNELRNLFLVYDVTDPIAIRAGELNATMRRNGTPVGLADILIAATALELGFGVLTHNVRHFSYVPGLVVRNAAEI